MYSLERNGVVCGTERSAGAAVGSRSLLVVGRITNGRTVLGRKRRAHSTLLDRTLLDRACACSYKNLHKYRSYRVSNTTRCRLSIARRQSARKQLVSDGLRTELKLNLTPSFQPIISQLFYGPVWCRKTRGPFCDRTYT